MSYRVEISVTGRAGCSATECKKEGKKIGKGELRQGVAVQFQEHTSMKWRHWGCVTPTVIHNWTETTGGDMDLVDGFEELPEDAQEKVRRTFEQGHVDDDDWNGDIENNRYDPKAKQQGMFAKGATKKAKAEGEDEDEKPKKTTKKRGRKAATEEDDAEEAEAAPAAKKAKGRKPKTITASSDAVDGDGLADADEPKLAAKKSKSKKTAKESDQAEGAVDETAQPQKRKSRAKKTAKD